MDKIKEDAISTTDKDKGSNCSKKIKTEQVNSAFLISNHEGISIPKDDEKKEQDDLLKSIFENQLIAETIADKLTFADLKTLSQVSKTCYQMVRETKRFLEKSILHICEQMLLPDPFIINSTCQWKNVQLDLTLPIMEILDFIPTILQNVRQLELQKPPHYYPNVKHLKTSDLNKILTTILTHSPKLKHLKIGGEVLDEQISDTLSKIQVQKSFTQLKALEIQPNKLICDSSDSRSTYSFKGRENDSPFPKNLLQLSLIPGTQLEIFKTPLINSCFPSNSSSRHHRKEQVKSISSIIAANSSTLKELHFNLSRLRSLKTVSCPVLKILNINVDKKNPKLTISFIKNQPILEDLTLRIQEGFPIQVLTSLKDNFLKLRKLHIKAKYFHHSTQNVDWSFLSCMKNLEDFSIYRPFREHHHMLKYGIGTTFLSLLPVEKLKKIELRGIRRFWFQTTAHQEEMREIHVPQRIQMLNQFKNVTELRLTRSINSINDPIMQNIIGTFRELKVLEFSHCDSLTDFGITGVHYEGEETGVSMKNLKSLTRLKIRSCPLITNSGILAAVVLPNLTSFDYLASATVTIEFVLKFAEQNQSLEYLLVLPSMPQTHEEAMKELSAVNRQVTKFSNHENQRALCLRGWDKADSDSDADYLDCSSDYDTSGTSLNTLSSGSSDN